MRIPKQGLPEGQLFERLTEYRSSDMPTHGGQTWAYVYDSGRRDVESVGKRAYQMFLSENGLDPTAFPSLARMENEVIAMCAAHLGGDSEVAGTFTSGGTESCMLAMKTARDRALALHPHIKAPEVVVPATVHAAFHKGAHYFGIKLVVVPVHPETYEADVVATRAAITDQTIMLVGSAVSYAHGVLDPIQELAALAQEHKLLMHVDGCIGGFLLPYIRRMGESIPDFDFAVPGVTSISMDLHKYAYCPKGASVLLHRNRALRQHQYFACASWTGYTIINPTMLSTRSGGPVAAAWSVMNYVGDEGYMTLSSQTRDVTRQIVAAVESIPELYVMGNPRTSLVAIASDTIDIFELVDEMNSLGWYVQAQFGYMGSKPNLHLSVTATSVHRVSALIADLQRCTRLVADRGSDAGLDAGLQALLGSIDLSTFSAEQLPSLLALVGVENGRLPTRLAPINRLLNQLPPPVTEQILIGFANNLFVQPE
jgi:glutamate/tyrosine decarboxylase-like PLP-dependent enzyme